MIYFFIKSNEILNGWWNCSCCCRCRCSRDVFGGIVQIRNVIVFMPIKFRWMHNVFALQIYLRQKWNNSQIDSEYGHAWCFIDSLFISFGIFLHWRHTIGRHQPPPDSDPWTVASIFLGRTSYQIALIAESRQSTASIEHFSLIY